MKLSRTRCFRRVMKYSINVDQRFENGNFEREKGGKGEKSMNGDIIFLPCIIRNRACRCRRVKISYVPGILVYISGEYRNLSVSSSSLQSGDFNFPAIDRAKKGKSIDRASPPRRQFISNA